MEWNHNAPLRFRMVLDMVTTLNSVKHEAFALQNAGHLSRSQYG